MGLLQSAANPQEVWSAFSQAKADADAQGYLYRLQGNPEAAARVEMEWATDFALSFAAANRVGQVGKLSGVQQISTARARQQAMLLDDVGFNISPTSWDEYPTIGRNGSFVSDQQGVMGYFGDVSGKSEITISPSQAAKIERDMGLVPGSLQEGFKVRKVSGLKSMEPTSPLEGNSYFRGPGNHLPGGAPEMVVRSIPTLDNGVVTTLLKVKVSPK